MELLVASGLMIVILGATLTSMEGFTTTTRISADQNDSQEVARRAMDQLARELRNHAVANTQAPEGIALATPFDLIFETVGRSRPAGSANTANVERVRYCLDAAAPGTLWVQTQAWMTASAPAVPSAAACPSGQWGTQRIVAEDLVNRLGSATRAVFTYDSGTPSQVRRVEITLLVDTTPASKPKATQLQSAIFLRNANSAPTAAFSVTVSGNGRAILNGTASTDPEGERLAFTWKVDGTTIAATGAIAEQAGLTTGSHQIELRVTDPGGVPGSAQQLVAVP
jgi:type II secretory pathway pseudopilin PulG